MRLRRHELVIQWGLYRLGQVLGVATFGVVTPNWALVYTLKRMQ